MELLKERPQRAEVKTIGYGVKTSLWNAIFNHAIFAHASELEDDRFGSAESSLAGVSWDITVLPVTFTLAVKNKLSGKEFLEASIVDWKCNAGPVFLQHTIGES